MYLVMSSGEPDGSPTPISRVLWPGWLRTLVPDLGGSSTRKDPWPGSSLHSCYTSTRPASFQAHQSPFVWSKQPLCACRQRASSVSMMNSKQPELLLWTGCSGSDWAGSSSGRAAPRSSFTAQWPDGWQLLLLQSIFHLRARGAREGAKPSVQNPSVRSSEKMFNLSLYGFVFGFVSKLR